MSNRLLNNLLAAGAFWLVGRYRRISLDVLKIKAAAVYIRAIQGTRRGVLAAAAAWLGIFFFALGLLLLHAGLFMWVYLWSGSLRTVALAIVILGAVYALVVLVALCHFLSEENWLKMFGADKMVDDLVRKD